MRTILQRIPILATISALEPNAEVGVIHPKAMPVILTAPEQIDLWLTAPIADAIKLQLPLPDGALKIVARGQKQDGPAL